MDNQQGQQASFNEFGEETKPSTAAVHSRSEQTRYLPMPADPTAVKFPPHFTDIPSENHFAQAVTVDQQRELTHYVRGLNGRMEREFEERHDDLRRLRAAFEQMGRDVRDLQDEELTVSTSNNGLETIGVPPQQVLEIPANPPYPTMQHPPVVPNQRESHPQPQPIVVMLPTMYAPRPIPAVPRRFLPRQVLPPRQPIRLSPEAPIFIPPDLSASGARSSRPSTSTSFPPGPGHTGPNVTVIPASSSNSQNRDSPRDHNEGVYRHRVDQPLPRQSMGSDVFVVPLSSNSTRSSPARGMSSLAQHPSITSLRERGTLRRTPSARSQRSQTSFIVTNPPSPVHTLLGPVLSTPSLCPAAPQPMAIMQQSPQSQPMIQRVPSPLPAAVMSTSGPEQIHGAEFPILHSPPDAAPVPLPIPSPVSPLLMPGAARGRQVTPPPAIIRQNSPVSRLRRAQTPFQATQPVVLRSSPTRLSKRHRPQPTRTDPAPVILPQPTGPIPPPPQPEVVVMPARTKSMHSRQSYRQLRPIDTSVAVPTPAVTAMTYPETAGHVRTRPSIAPIIPQPSPVSSYGDFRTAVQPVLIRRSPSRLSSHRGYPTTPFPQPRPISSNSSFRSSMQAAEQPAVIRRSPSRSSSRRRAQPNTTIRTQPSRLSKRRKPQPTATDPVLPSQPIGRVPPSRQPEVVLMPARTGSMRNHQNRRQLRPIDTSGVVPRPVTAMTYPETISHARTTARTSTAPFIIPQSTPTSSDSSRSPSRSPRPTTTTTTRPSRLTKPVPPPPQPEIVVMPARTESMRSRQSRRQLRPIDGAPSPAAVTALTYPETVSQGRTTAQRPQPRPISSNSSFIQPIEPLVIRRSSSSSSSRRRAQPDTSAPTQPSRLTKRRRPQPTSVAPPAEAETVLMPRTESMRTRQSHRQLRPIDTPTGVPTTRAVTAMTYPETVSHVRMTAPASTVVPLHTPTSSNNSFRAPMQAAKQSVVIRTSPSFHRAPQRTLTTRPEIVVLPPRSSHSTDSSPIMLPSPLGPELGHLLSGGPGALSDFPHPQLGDGAFIMPIDSDAEEPMLFRPVVERRASFSGRDMVSYESRSRAYSSDDDSPLACVTPTSFRGRSRSPHAPLSVVTPTSRQSQSPPQSYYHPTSTDLWDQQKSRTHSQRGWYRSSGTASGSISPPASLSVNPPRRPPPPAGRALNKKASGPIINTFSIHGEIRTRGAQQPLRNGDGLGEVIARGVVRGGLERPRERDTLGHDLRPKRMKSSWSGWLAGL